MHSKKALATVAVVMFGMLAFGTFAFTQSAITFVRGDSNGDGFVDISDVSHLAGYLFRGTTDVTCLAAADANDDETVDISDMVYVLDTLFVSGNPIPLPWPDAGADPTPGLSCDG